MEKKIENQITLYTLLVNQIQKYNAILWQFPTLLSAANIVAFTQLFESPFVLLGLSIINLSLIFAFYKMIIRQKQIIESTKKAEKKLKKYYNDFLPNFNKSPKDWMVNESLLKIKAPNIVFTTLLILNALLFIYSLNRISC